MPLFLNIFGHPPSLVQVGPGGHDQGDQGVRGPGGDRTTSRNTIVPRQRKRSVKERNEAAEAFAHTALMKKKLQEARDSFCNVIKIELLLGSMPPSTDHARA